MTTAYTGTEQGTTPAPRNHALDDLRRAVVGPLHTPQDPTWDLARMPWAVNNDQRPLAVLEAHDADDVQAAVRWAVQHDVQVTAQPTGHGTTGAFEDVLLLRTKGIGGIDVDLDRRTVTIGAGVQAGALLAALDGTGLTFLAGSNPDPSVVGMTVQGGISWFGRAYGVGADSIVSLEMVDGMGRLRRVDDSDP
jgi:FAD/FMN-containing dehydrogenase